MYALHVERADAGDAVTVPTLLASGRFEPEAVSSASARGAVDTWLSAAVGAEADAEEALVSWLRG